MSEIRRDCVYFVNSGVGAAGRTRGTLSFASRTLLLEVSPPLISFWGHFMHFRLTSQKSGKLQPAGETEAPDPASHSVFTLTS